MSDDTNQKPKGEYVTFFLTAEAEVLLRTGGAKELWEHNSRASRSELIEGLVNSIVKGFKDAQVRAIQHKNNCSHHPKNHKKRS